MIYKEHNGIVHQFNPRLVLILTVKVPGLAESYVQFCGNILYNSSNRSKGTTSNCSLEFHVSNNDNETILAQRVGLIGSAAKDEALLMLPIYLAVGNKRRTTSAKVYRRDFHGTTNG